MDMPIILPYPETDSADYCSSPEAGQSSVHSASPDGEVNQMERAASVGMQTYLHSESISVSRRMTRQAEKDSTYLSESPLSNQANVKTDSDNTDHYDSVMQWLNQQACGGTVKRKRKINKQQRLAANMRERRRMTSLNSAFERLKETIPIFPYEKKLSRIQTLRLAIDYIEFMGNILHQPTENGSLSTCQQEHPTEDVNLTNSAGQSPSSSTTLHLSPDCIQKLWH